MISVELEQRLALFYAHTDAMEDWENVLIPLLKYLSTVYCRMQEKLLQRLQSFMQKLSLKSIELFRISFIRVILIDSWKNQINLRFQTK